MKISRTLPLAAAVALLTACSTNGSSINPSVNQVNLQKTAKLQLAVGTINYGPDGNATGLNTVVTFRQPNGLSAALVSTPSITGPGGFTAAGDPQGTATPTGTFGTSGGAFSYGFAPDNSDQSGSPNFGLYPEPFFGTNQISDYGGAPAYPFIYNGTYPPGFSGYSQGWTAFEVTPSAGTYNLTVNVPVANGPSATFNASANLTNTTPLPAIAAPGFAEDGVGGGTITAAVPPDPRIVESMAYVATASPTRYYTVGPVTGTGTLQFVLPPNLGPCAGSNCQNGSGATPTIAAGQSYTVYVISYDYPMFEASPPGNTSQTPTITGANGQADLSVSQLTNGAY